MPTSRSRQRRTQQERRAATQHRVLEAAVDCLLEDGYAGLTTSRVAQRTGVSRGAQLHHYPTRETLVVAAVEHLANRRAAELRDQAARWPDGADRIPAALGLLWSLVASPLFQAGLELWVAARTDPVLRDALAPFEHDLDLLAHELVAQLFGRPARDHPDFAEVVRLVLNAMYGAALRRLLHPEATFDEQWSLLERAVTLLLSSPPQHPASPGVLS